MSYESALFPSTDRAGLRLILDGRARFDDGLQHLSDVHRRLRV